MFRKEHFRAILSLSFIVIDWSHLLRKVNAGYKLGKQKKINHILFMHNFIVYGNSKKETERVTNTVRIFSKDIAMGFGISECADITIMQKNLLVLVECNSHQKNQLELESDKVSNYLGILEPHDMIYTEKKYKITKGIL